MRRCNDKNQSAAAELRRHAEERLKADLPEAQLPRTEHEIRRLYHELQVHQIELEMQNAELRKARDEVEKALEEYTDLYDFAPVGYFTLDRNGDIRAVNLTGAGLLGVERSRLIGRRFGQFVTEEFRPFFAEFLGTVFASQGKESCDLALPIKGGLPVVVQIEAVAAASGQECRIAIIDITVRKRAEEDLLNSEEIFRAIGDSIEFGVWVCTPDGRNIYASDSFLNLVGLTQEQCSDFGWGDVLHPDDVEGTITAWKECVRTEGVWDVEHRYRGVDGQWHPILARGVPIRNSSGEIIKWAGINLDISRIKQVEEKLRGSERQLIEAQQIAHLGNWQWDSIANTITGSDEFFRIFGGCLSRYEEFLSRVHPDDREMVNEAVQDTLDRQSPYNIHYRIVHPDGGSYIVHARGQAIVDAAGTVVRMIGTAQDVTEQRLVEHALTAKQQELEELNRFLELRIVQAVDEMRRKDQMLILHERQALMGEMINNIAHQWRQPLNTLGLVIQQLPLFYDAGQFSRELLEENTERGMKLIQHMSQTIDSFKNFFRADKEAVAFSVNQVIAHTLSLIEDALREQMISISFCTEGDPTLTGNRNEYAQVILNILMNARDALVERKVVDPRISLHAFTEGDKTVVTISDNAGGIDEEIIGRIFEPYFTTKALDKGTGIGLFMSRTIIEKNMGGRLKVRNAGDGAEFRIEV